MDQFLIFSVLSGVFCLPQSSALPVIFLPFCLCFQPGFWRCVILQLLYARLFLAQLYILNLYTSGLRKLTDLLHLLIFLAFLGRYINHLNRHGIEQALGVGQRQGSLACCSPWGRKESDTTEQLNWTEVQNSEKIQDSQSLHTGEALRLQFTWHWTLTSHPGRAWLTWWGTWEDCKKA